MATAMFDPAQIDAAVGDAFGVKVKPTAKPPAAPAPVSGGQSNVVISEQLLDSLRKVESGGDTFAINKKTKAMGPYQFMPDTVQMLHKQGIKFNAFDEAESREAARKYLTQLAQRHNGNIELALKDYGGFITKNPTEYVNKVTGGATASAKPSSQPAQTAGQLNVDDLMNPEAVNAAVAEAFNEPPKKGKVASKVTSFLRSSAALADTITGVVPGVAGMVTYAGARAAGQTPEEAEATKGKVVSAIDRPFGKAFGITETPEYKGEVTQQLMQYIGENVNKGADFISKQTGMSKPEVQYYMELGLTALPFSKTVQREAGLAGQAVKQAGGKVLQATKDVTPVPVQRAVTRGVEAIAPGTTRMSPRAPTLGFPGQPTSPVAGAPGAAVSGAKPTGRASIGAAGTPDATIIRQALTTATPEFQQLYGNMPLDKVNTPVVLRHLEADSLPIPVRLTEGEATGNPILISEEMNLRGQFPEFAMRKNEVNQQLVDNVPLIRERAAPDVYATKTIESSQAIIDSYKALDDVRSAEISKAYKALEDAAGGEFPVDGVTLAKNSEAGLAKKLKSDFLSPAIKNQLDRFKNGEPMTFEQFEAMRTNLAAEIRKAERSGDGNAAMAASIVREALEQLPLKGEAAALKPIADTARTLAKARFDALKKDPAYKAAVTDAISADKYFNKFVINGDSKNINTMIDALGRDSLGHQHIKAGTINHLSDKAGIMDGKGNFSQANYNKALKQLDDFKKFGTIFDPESQLQLRTLGNVAAYTQFQPRGSFVNNSNTLVGYLANKAAGGAEQIGNIAGLKFAGGIPVGTMARQAVQKSKGKARVKKALEPGAGSTLSEVSRQGQIPRVDIVAPPRIDPTLD
jgi:hypothetical protein